MIELLEGAEDELERDVELLVILGLLGDVELEITLVVVVVVEDDGTTELELVRAEELAEEDTPEVEIVVVELDFDKLDEDGGAVPHLIARSTMLFKDVLNFFKSFSKACAVERKRLSQKT